MSSPIKKDSNKKKHLKYFLRCLEEAKMKGSGLHKKLYLYSEEAKIKGSEFVGLFEINEKTPHYIAVAAKSLCFIDTPNDIASGFLIKFMKNNEDFYCLMTNEHVVGTELVENNESIIFYYDNKKERREIILDKGNRYIKCFKNKLNIDATVIEILPEDNIPNDYFLIPDSYYMKKNNLDKLKGKEITILQYPSDEYKDAKYSTGKLIEIFRGYGNKYEFSHLASTLHGSSGSPIILNDTVKVIGIHKGGVPNLKNFGDFIGPIYEYFKKKFLILPFINAKIKDGYGKYIYENGDYYKGEWKDYLRNGFGTLYNKNGEIIYAGEWVNNERQGFGVSRLKNGEVEYKGNWFKDKIDGKGILRDENGKIIYDGEWKNNLKNGQGKIYYKNGKIKYEGNWVDDKKDGEGKFYDENGKIIYDGMWKNDSVCEEKKSDYDNSSKIKNSEPGIQVSFQPAPQPTSQIIYLPTAQQNYFYNVYNGMMFNGNVLFVNK